MLGALHEQDAKQAEVGYEPTLLCAKLTPLMANNALRDAKDALECANPSALGFFDGEERRQSPLA